MAASAWDNYLIYVDVMRLRQAAALIEESVAGLGTGAGRLRADPPDRGPAGLALQQASAAWVGDLTALKDAVAAIAAALASAADGYAEADASALALWSRP